MDRNLQLFCARQAVLVTNNNSLKTCRPERGALLGRFGPVSLPRIDNVQEILAEQKSSLGETDCAVPHDRLVTRPCRFRGSPLICSVLEKQVPGIRLAICHR